jgi:hypothetical protein
MGKMLSRKHFRQVANVMKEAKDKVVQDCQPDALVALHHVADGLVQVFKEDNPRFNPDKFYDACGLQAPLR